MDDFAPWLGVFETLRVVNGVPLFAEEHHSELRRAAKALGIQVNLDLAKAIKQLPKLSGRCRWLVTPKGTMQMFNEEEMPSQLPLSLGISSVRVGSQNWDARFKTVSYLSHAQALKDAPFDDMVLLNERGEVTSTARANLFWRRDGRLYTPGHDAGCRCGVIRGFVLGRQKVEEGFFSVEQLLAADEIFITNSLRGIVSVQRMGGEVRNDFSTADELRTSYDQACHAQVMSYPLDY